jgi:predicted NAD-dependent protein-ADP-ribosyltransferase YbiA (DUF1768 family)/SAM-dependent methyltransferase
MDLFKAEIEKFKEIIHLWQDHPNEELEATFGANGHVDVSTFYAVIRRLQSKGYTITQEPDKLNIITPAVERNAKSAIVPTGCRFTISGYGQIEQYCRDDTITSKTYSVMFKDNTRAGAKLALEDYDAAVKLRQEIELFSDGDTRKANEEPLIREVLQRWPIQRKAFRMIRRWSSIDEAKGIRIDLSIVQQTKRTSKGEYKWETTFQKQNFLKNPAIYEIEVELLHNDANSTEEKSLKNLIRGMGEVLRGIQKNVLLIRKSVFQRVIRQYASLVFPGATIGTSGPKFRGVNPETLQVDNMSSEMIKGRPNIRNNFNVTDKADGLRVMMFCNEDGELYLLDMNMNVYRTNLKSVACANTLLDAEWITKSKTGEPRQYVLAFDIYIGLGGKVVSKLPYVQSDPDKKNEDRQTKFKEWFEAWNSSNPPAGKSEKPDLMKFIILPKTFFHGKGDTTIFQACKRCLEEDTGRDYYTDGLILTSNEEPIPDGARVTFKQQFKWKPSNDNTIDFLVKFEKEETGEDKISFVGDKEFKTMRLFVAASRETAYDDPRSTILNDLPLPEIKPHEKGQLKPVIFTPINYNDTMASVCYRKVHRRPGSEEAFVACEVRRSEEDESSKLTGDEADDPDAIDAMGEPIQDGSIVEMRFEPSNDPGWRWIPIRIRNDKTERFQRGQIEKTMNTDFVANSNWDSIYNPVTLHMITTGADTPLPEEINAISSILAERKDLERKYYDRKAPKDDMMIVKGLSNFHNKWIKKSVLLGPTLKPEVGGSQKTLIDIACGKIGDVHKWIELQPSFVLGVDYAGDCITDKKDGAYRRFINVLRSYGKDNVPPMVFCVGDSSKQYITGEAAGDLREDADILRAVFGKETEAAVPKYVDEVCAGRLSRGADVIACMFALHYFFRDKATFNGLLENLRNILKVGGYFVGCTFDGDGVFEFMRDTKQGVAKVGKAEDDTEIWKLTKQYEIDKDLPYDDDGFGHALDVNFISIGLKHTEYLVPFRLLEEKMKQIGCRLLDETECSALGFPGLKTSTRMFKDELAAAKKKGGKDFGGGMPDPVKQFSFLNRWFIFKRTGETYGAEAAVAADATSVRKSKKEGKLKKEESAARPESGVGEALAKEEEKVVAPEVGSPDPERKWQKAQIFEFGRTKGSKEPLGIKNSRRILSLNYPFMITDPENNLLVYPSIEHYLAAMKYKLATKPKRPDLASLFTSTGALHQEYLTKLKLKQGAQKKELSADDKQELINEETNKVLRESSVEGMAAKKVVFDEALWDSVKDGLLEEALKKRFERDEEVKAILRAAKDKSLYLLYSSPGDMDFGGDYGDDKKIHGDNKVGRLLMKLAVYTP